MSLIFRHDAKRASSDIHLWSSRHVCQWTLPSTLSFSPAVTQSSKFELISGTKWNSCLLAYINLFDFQQLRKVAKMPLVQFAPLRIPLHRRLETAAVALYYYSFYFGALVGALIIIGLFFTSFYPLALLYLAWAYLIDSGTPDHGGRRSAYVRKLRVWKYFRDYFPISLVKTTELDAEKNYIFGYHPHGLLCAGAFCNFATEATNFSEVFPGITPHLLPLMGESYSVFILFTF